MKRSLTREARMAEIVRLIRTSRHEDKHVPSVVRARAVRARPRPGPRSGSRPRGPVWADIRYRRERSAAECQQCARVVEKLFQRAGIERRGHDDEFQVGPGVSCERRARASVMSP